MQDFPEASRLLGPEAVFMLLFVTLGPIKIVGPFAQLTRDVDEAQMKQTAVRAFVLAVVVGGFLGKTAVENWQISVPGCARGTDYRKRLHAPSRCEDWRRW